MIEDKIELLQSAGKDISGVECCKRNAKRAVAWEEFGCRGLTGSGREGHAHEHRAWHKGTIKATRKELTT